MALFGRRGADAIRLKAQLATALLVLALVQLTSALWNYHRLPGAGRARPPARTLHRVVGERGASPDPLPRWVGSGSWLYGAEPVRDRRRFDAIAHPELAEDVRDVDRRRLGTDEQGLGDLPVRSPDRHQGQHFLLTFGETQPVERRRRSASADRAGRLLGPEVDAPAPRQGLRLGEQ